MCNPSRHFMSPNLTLQRITMFNKVTLTNKHILTVSLLSALVATSPAAYAQESDSLFSFSANAAVVSDYRFRGISLSNRDFAIQGGLDISTKSGFYLGTWGSSIESYSGSETELDIYGGYSGEVGALTYDVGLLAYTYPGSDGTAYLEGYASLSGSAQKLDWTVGYAYAFNQDSIGGQDNSYIYLDTALPLGDTGLNLAGHIAYENGAFGDDKLDWSMGLTYPIGNFEAGITYIDTNIENFGAKTIASGTVVFSLGASF